MKVSNEKILLAVRTLIQWLGDDPDREGLRETPERVVDRYKKIFGGYRVDLDSILKKPSITAKEGMGMVLVPDIEFLSFCEHHILPVIGKIYVAYIPAKKLAGIGTIIKIVNAFSRRLQLQERLTIQIAETIESYLNPKGVAICVKAKHYCIDREETGAMNSELCTYHFLGVFGPDKELQQQFLSQLNKN